MSEVKNIDSLMRHLRNTHNIAIEGSVQKRRLRNIGYYHGFKGYRYISTPGNTVKPILYTDFNQILAINSFDMELKSIFYPHIMFIETALKNYVLEIVLDQSKTDNFNVIFDAVLTNYKTFQVGSQNYKVALSKRLGVREKFYNTLTRSFTNNKKVVQHFYQKDEHVPIWAIFEVITLGEFGNFVAAANGNIKRDTSKSLNLNQSCDANGKLTESIIYILKDLRNSIAHNDVIFDTRFKSGKPNNSLISCLQLDTKIPNITFNTIADYFILVIYLLKNFHLSKTELGKIIAKFEASTNQIRAQIPITIYNQIFLTDTKNKLQLLKDFIK